MKYRKKIIYIILFICIIVMGILDAPANVLAAKTTTNIRENIVVRGHYANWDGVSNVAQFVYKGQYCFAYCKKKKVYIVKTKNGKVLSKKIVLEMQYPIFGSVTSDNEGNFYLVTGKNNKTNNTSVNTVFVSKYDANGNHIKTVGDNGSSSLDYYYGNSFYTKYPFDGGNCDVAVNGNKLAINYAREMYSGHQSNSVLIINTDTMEKIHAAGVYESHSFAQRAIPFGDDFIFASEGDCYNRAFTISVKDNERYNETPIFDFWVKKDTLSNWDMYTLNDNFAHMGGLANINDKLVALVSTSAKALNKTAVKQNEQLFIQIFNPNSDLSTPEAYMTSGKRSGVAGPNGDIAVTNYGVKWLTNYSNKVSIANPQVVSDGNGKIVVLYEKYIKGSFKGVYYLILDDAGNIIKKETCFSTTAQLNPCRMPVYVNGKVYWTGNNYKDTKAKLYI